MDETVSDDMVFIPTGASKPIATPRSVIGGYNIGNDVAFVFPHKPHWWHRVWCRVLLGWVWQDIPGS